MAYQVRSKTSYGQRVSGSFKGIATGFLLFIAGTILLFWNEGNFVKTKKALQEAEGVMVEAGDVSTLDPSLHGKLVHASAFADTRDVLTDGLFGISETAISISRKVEYYQYVEYSKTETRDLIGGGQESVTTYTYEQKWVSAPVNSADFNDPSYRSYNYVLANVESRTVRVDHVTFGAYKLPPFIISSISGSIPAEVKLTEQQVEQWEKTIVENRKALGFKPDTVAIQRIHISGNVVYVGKSPSVAATGDVRVTLTKILPADISIIAQVNGSTFEKYTAENGKTVSEVSMGTVSAKAMFSSAHSMNSVMTWILRLLGIILIIVGLKSMFSILPTLFKVLPFLGKIVGAGVGLVCTVGGIAWSLLIIALSWLWYRPLIGILLLVLVVAGIWFLRKKGKEKS